MSEPATKAFAIFSIGLTVLSITTCSSVNTQSNLMDTKTAKVALSNIIPASPGEPAENESVVGIITDSSVEHTIEFSHTYFKPSEVTISRGDTVIFLNLSNMSHPLYNEDLHLNTKEFKKGKRSFTFNQIGSFTITNTAHHTEFIVNVVEDEIQNK